MVTAVQDGVEGAHSTINSFFVNEGGLCPSPGTPGTAKRNFFCRKGTYEIFEPLWTVENGHRVLAIARNPQSTYVLLNILDQNTLEPFEHEIKCWAYLGNIIPGWPETLEEVEFDFGDLPAMNPPDPPEEEPEPAPEPVCQINLGAEECKKAGGTYDSKNVCHCP